MFLFVPLGERSFFISIDKDKSSGEIIIPKEKDIPLGIQDIKMLLDKLVPPIFLDLGYTQEEIGKIKEVLEKPVVDIKTIIHMVESVRSYEETNEMDVVISGHTWRMKDKDFLNPTSFQIWSASVLFLTVDISKEKWKAFVSYLVSISKKEKEDPLGPNIIDELLKKMKMTSIYNDFCDDLLESWVNGSREFLLLKEGKLYVPASILDSISKKLEITKKKVRDTLQPLLDKENSVVLFRRWNGKGISKRVWIINFEKLKTLRELDDIEIVEVKKDGVQT